MTSIRKTTGQFITIIVLIVLFTYVTSFTYAQSSSIVAFDLNSQGTQYVTGHSDRTVRVWNANTHSLISEFQEIGPDEGTDVETYTIQDIAFSPDGQKLAISFGGTVDIGTVRVIDANNGAVLLSLAADAFAGAIDWNSDGSQLAVLTSFGIGTLKSSYLKVWDNSGDLVADIRLLGQSTLSLAWSPDGTLLANSSGNDITVWNTSNWSILSTLGNHEPSVTSLAWNPNGIMLAITGSDNIVSIWNVSTGEQEKSFNKTISDRGIHLVDWNSDGTKIATTVSSAIEVWDVTQEQHTLVFDAGNDIRGLQWKPDGTILYTAGTVQTLIESPTATPTSTPST